MSAILQSGFQRSGNYWLYNIILHAQRAAGMEIKRFITSHPFYQRAKSMELSNPDQREIDVLDIDPTACHIRVGFHLRERLKDLDDYLLRTSHVWTHSPLVAGNVWHFERFDKILYIVRDPRDMIVSMSRFAFTPYMLQSDPHGLPTPEAYLKHKTADLARDWVKHVGGHLKFKDHLKIHFVFYERLLEDFDRELQALLDYLMIRLEPMQIQNIREETSFKSMHAQAPHHVQKGERAGWKDVLTEEQVSLIHCVAGPIMKILSYSPASDTGVDAGPATQLPRLPQLLDPTQLAVAEGAARRTHVQILRYGMRFLVSPRPLSGKIKVLRRRLSQFSELLWRLR